MSSDKESESTQQPCPFCGKSFKRLKTHLPHCKMAPVAKETKSSKSSSRLHTCAESYKTAKKVKPNKTDAQSASPHTRTASTSQVNLTVPNQTQDVIKVRTCKKSKTVNRDPSSALKVKAKAPTVLVMGRRNSTGKNSQAKQKPMYTSRQSQEAHGLQMPPKMEIQHVSALLGALTKGGAGAPTSPLFFAPTNEALEENAKTKQSTRTPEFCWTKTSVWDHIKSSLLDRSRTVALDAKRWEAARLGSATVGLQHMPELAMAYKAVGLSMLPESTHRGCVYRAANPISALEQERTMKNFAVHCQLRKDPVNIRGSDVNNITSTGPLAERPFMEVRLVELPTWLVSRHLLSPTYIIAACHRGWQRYYSKYIDVRKGGVGGLAMMLAGYCVLSYTWTYPQHKHERWRRYH